jgi:uncharacterized protein YyaL (SSP411 family)
MGMPGFQDLLVKLHDYWVNKRDEVTRSADSLVNAVQRISLPEFEETELTAETLRGAMRSLLSAADRRHGGFGDAPKFPHPMDVRVLLRCAQRFGDEDALAIARLTLDKMAAGGIYDHLGGGFHRYSTDAQWLVPHFEKMLYDNALLIPAYIEAFQLSQSFTYLVTVKETLDYVVREMTAPDGGFYSTQDADSEGEEGKFFVWTEDEIVSLLGPEDARVFNYCYDVTPRGNWEGKCILNRPKTDEQAAVMLGISPEVLTDTLTRCRQKLFAARSERVAPERDDKIIVAWNGLMIAAIALAVRGRTFGADEEWSDEEMRSENAPDPNLPSSPHPPRSSSLASRALSAAEHGASFILENMTDESGNLLHTFKDGRARINAFLDDYACLIDGLVELYQTTFKPDYLASAVTLAEQMIGRFADDDRGGFFYTPADHETLIARSKDAQDSAVPSGNGMAACALLKLGRLTGRPDLEDRGWRTLRSLSGLLTDHPRAAGQALLALDFHVGPARELVLIDGDDPRETERVLSKIAGRFLPHLLVVRHGGGEPPAVLLPLLEGKQPEYGGLTSYVCERGACGLPATGVEGALESLNNLT